MNSVLEPLNGRLIHKKLHFTSFIQVLTLLKRVNTYTIGSKWNAFVFDTTSAILAQARFVLDTGDAGLENEKFPPFITINN